MIKKIPIPLGGVALALASLANLLGGNFRTVLSIISVLLLIVFLVRLIVIPKMLKEELNNSLLTSNLATFPMAMIILSGFIKELSVALGKIFFYGGLLIFIIIMIYFFYRFFIKDFKLKDVHASYYIPFVGIVVGSVIAPAWQMQSLGKILFYFGMITYIPLFYIVNKRYIKEKNIPEPFRPTFCITAAPASLLLAGYLNSFNEKNITFIVIWLILSQILYFISIVKIPSFIKKGFYPTFAAFTFPTVISAIALKGSTGFFTKAGYNTYFLPVLTQIEIIIASFLVAYVLVQFLQFILIDPTTDH